MVVQDALAELAPRWSGPWHEHELEGLPEAPGLYCVCECAPDDSRQGWRITRPLFIGKAANARQALLESDQWDRWRALARQGHGLCFGFRALAPAGQEAARGALVAYYRPPGNAARP